MSHVREMKMLAVGGSPIITVGFPLYRAQHVAWIALESLVRQRIGQQWELVIAEENNSQIFGFKRIEKYAKRLKKAGCVRVIYRSLDRWVPLSRKWPLLVRMASSTSKYFVFQAADSYASPDRLHLTYSLLERTGAAYFHSHKQYIYDLSLDKLVIWTAPGYTAKRSFTGCNLAAKTNIVCRLPKEDVSHGVDGWLLKNIGCLKDSDPLEVVCKDPRMWKYGVNIRGLGNISYTSIIFSRANQDARQDQPKSDLTKFLPRSVLRKFEKLRPLARVWKVRPWNRRKTDDMETINQVCVSPSVEFFRGLLCRKYGLREYRKPNRPAFFFGCYNQTTVQKICNHQSLAVVIWCGGDSKHLHNRKIMTKLPHVRHVAIGKWTSEDLMNAGLAHIVLPICPTDIRKFRPTSKGKAVYVYGSHRNARGMGEHLARKVEKLLPDIKFIFRYVVPPNNTPYNEMSTIYQKCFIGLRLTPHDGLPNTVVEMGLMGRLCVYNGWLPNSIQWENLNDVVEAIRTEQRMIGTINHKIARGIKKYLELPPGWKKTEFYL